MKRYFLPVSSDPSKRSKAPAQSSEGGDFRPGDGEPPPGDAADDHDQNGAAGAAAARESTGVHASAPEPLRFMTWNVNSLLLRLKNNKEEVFRFIENVDPDVIALQEVKMPAAGAKGEPKRAGALKDDSNGAREEKGLITRALATAPLSAYRCWWSLADSKYSGSALLVKHTCPPVSVRFCLDDPAPAADAGSAAGGGGSRGPGGGGRAAERHEADGRAILAEWAGVRVLSTYAPNNTWKDDATGFQRRRAWDRRMLEFVAAPQGKPLVWCGDMNVSHEAVDVSHPEFFRNARKEGCTPPDPEDKGQPGYTANECRRFGEILKRGCLIDTYRWLHREKEADGFTWSGNPVGKYRGKRMRIDYFLISEQLLPRLVSSDIHGRGNEMEGFMGSDHCPLTMVLRPSPAGEELEGK